VPTPFLLIEHDIVAQRVGANANLLAWCCHSRKGAGVPCAPQLGHGAGSTLLPIESTPGLHGVVVIVRGDLTTEPPAHIRLVSGHDLFEMVASSDCTAWTGWARREGECAERDVSSFLDATGGGAGLRRLSNVLQP
jgi:hypothetical protein